MSDQPYRPPQSDLRVARASDLGGPQSFDLGTCWSEGWDATWSNFPLWLGVVALQLALTLASALTIVGIFLVIPVLLWGMSRFFLNMIDGRAAFRDLFSGFSVYVRSLSRIVSLMFLLLFINAIGNSVQAYGGFVGDQTVSAVGSVINLIWLVVVSLRLSFCYFFMVDQDLGPIETIQTCWRYTSGNLGHIVVLTLASTGVLLAGTMALIVGLVPATVVVYLMWTSAYRQMTGTGRHASSSLGIETALAR